MHLISTAMLPGLYVPAVMVGVAGILPAPRVMSMEGMYPSHGMGLGGAGVGLGDMFLSVTPTVRLLSLTVD
jgi:hypothetical protein